MNNRNVYLLGAAAAMEKEIWTIIFSALADLFQAFMSDVIWVSLQFCLQQVPQGIEGIIRKSLYSVAEVVRTCLEEI